MEVSEPTTPSAAKTMEVSEAAAPSATSRRRQGGLRQSAEEHVGVRRQTLETVLEECQRALELLKTAGQGPDASLEGEAAYNAAEPCANDHETEELCELIKSKVDSPDFLQKFGSTHMSVCEDNHASWDVVGTADLWEDKHVDGENDSDQDDSILVNQEDILEGIACFMAEYLLSLKQTKLLAKHFPRKKRVNFARHGMEAKLFTMSHLGVQLLLGYIKTQQ